MYLTLIGSIELIYKISRYKLFLIIEYHSTIKNSGYRKYNNSSSKN